LETLSHTPPGEMSFELDPSQRGRAVVYVTVAGVKQEFARCAAHDAPLVVLAMQAPHDCNHPACPGRPTLRRLDKVNALVSSGHDVVTGFGISYPDLVRALGQAPADALWGKLTALQVALALAGQRPTL
jgi:hypothetical protein